MHFTEAYEVVFDVVTHHQSDTPVNLVTWVTLDIIQHIAILFNRMCHAPRGVIDKVKGERTPLLS